jgi:hypothetical protein
MDEYEKIIFNRVLLLVDEIHNALKNFKAYDDGRAEGCALRRTFLHVHDGNANIDNTAAVKSTK